MKRKTFEELAPWEQTEFFQALDDAAIDEAQRQRVIYYGAEAAPGDWDSEEIRCGAYGPAGECHREAGHLDGAWAIGLHVSFDSDHYGDWRVGTISLSEARKRLLTAPPAPPAEASEEFKQGFAAALAQMRATFSGCYE